MGRFYGSGQKNYLFTLKKCCLYLNRALLIFFSASGRERCIEPPVAVSNRLGQCASGCCDGVVCAGYLTAAG